ncbi:hypothetical protein LCGC14_0861870 [marine sediment metagenome]|uniref:Uncharacterized protein n=1 Tax=marine sediment metagenome TaxID=412755 RepID=A0A0F9RRU6_9ZZZZ
MTGKLFMVMVIIIGVIITIGSFYAFVLNSPSNLLKRDIFLSPHYYYELPKGGYIYIDGEYIRYNVNSFNGTLDYQITLNYEVASP